MRRVIEPLLAGALFAGDTYQEDISYVRDLGLVGAQNPVQIANPIYREVIARVLSAAAEANVLAEPKTFVKADGRLDLPKLLQEFASFWREQGDALAAAVPYHEVAPQLVLMAFLQRVVNGGGYVEREYGLGRERIDLLVRWPYRDAERKPTWQREALELKVWREGEKDPKKQGLEQLERYLTQLDLSEGVLVIFDRRRKKKGVRFEQTATASKRRVTLLRA